MMRVRIARPALGDRPERVRREVAALGKRNIDGSILGETDVSHQAFIDFYTNYLESPAGEAARKQLDGIKDKQSFAATMAAVGSSSGFQFSADEVLSVMAASEAKAAKALAAASGELNEEQLDSVVGGTTSVAGIPTVNIAPVSSTSLSYSLGSLKLPGGSSSYSTVMCPW